MKRIGCKFKMLLALLIISITFIVYVIFFTQIGDRLAKYHVYADVIVRVDNVQQNMKGIKINHIFESGSLLETSHFDDYYAKIINNRQGNNVKFKEGIYGGNIFEFEIPKEYLKDFNNDIKVRFGYFNTNWWHVNKYTINVDINQISKERVNVTLYQKDSHITDERKSIVLENTESKEITPSDSIISIYSGP